MPNLQDERSREIMRELAKLNPQDPRVALFRGVRLIGRQQRIALIGAMAAVELDFR